MVRLLLTPTLGVEVRDARSQRWVHRVWGALQPDPVAERDPAVIVGDDLPPEVVASGAGPVEVGTGAPDGALWVACATAALIAGNLPLHGATLATAQGPTTIIGANGTGKTTALLAAMGADASLLAPEWVVVNSAGELEPLPGRLRLRPHHLPLWPGGSRSLPWRSRLRLHAMRAAAALSGTESRLHRAAIHRMHADVDLSAAMSTPSAGRLRRVLILQAERVDAPRVEELEPAAAATAVVSLLRDEVVARWTGSPEHHPTGDALDALVANVFAEVRPECLRIVHDHPSSGPQLAPLIAALAR